MDDRPDSGDPFEQGEERAYGRQVLRGLDEPLDSDVVDDVDDDEDFERRVARRRPGADVEELLREVLDVLEEARPMALSTAVKVDRDELWDLIEQALDRLPEELRSARWLIKERDEFLTRTQREADEILEEARAQSERMVQRSEVMRSAEATARRVIDDSRAEAARIRNACDDYCDQRLSQLEAVLERSLDVVSAGREKLRPRLEDDEPDAESYGDDADADASAEPDGHGVMHVRDGGGVDGHEDLPPVDVVDVKVFDQDRL